MPKLGVRSSMWRSRSTWTMTKHLDQKQDSQDSNQHSHMGCQPRSWWISLLHQDAEPLIRLFHEHSKALLLNSLIIVYCKKTKSDLHLVCDGMLQQNAMCRLLQLQQALLNYNLSKIHRENPNHSKPTPATDWSRRRSYFLFLTFKWKPQRATAFFTQKFFRTSPLVFYITFPLKYTSRQRKENLEL